jgi:hypothetical protein
MAMMGKNKDFVPLFMWRGFIWGYRRSYEFRRGTSAKLEQTSGNGDKQATRKPDLDSAAEPKTQ